MFKKLPAIIFIIISLFALPTWVSAQTSNSLKVHNTDFVTSDIYSTYIEGTISVADGQDIVLSQGMKTIARLPVPKSGTDYKFRIKVPPNYIKTDEKATFRVQSSGTDSVPESLPVKVEIGFRAKKPQTIKLAKDSFALSIPGTRTKIKASSSSGEDLRYVSSNPKIVKVDKHGNMTPIGKGSATISVFADTSSQFEGTSKSVSITVDQKDGYLIAYHPSIDKGEDTIKEQLFDLDTTQNLEDNTFENGDHKFLGWATEDGGPVKFADGESVNNIAENGSTLDLYAVWTGDGANAAVAWALEVAADDSFNYGYKPATATPGCYFCGTNKRNKPRGYEKTYVCMTFVHAAYAHGAEDPEMLADCQAGRYTVSLNDWNFGHWSCWEKVGRCGSLSVSDLEPGDVIIWWADDDASGHASIYAGDNDIVDAAVQGWGSESIAVREGAAAKYLRRGASMDSRSYVMRYAPPQD